MFTFLLFRIWRTDHTLLQLMSMKIGVQDPESWGRLWPQGPWAKRDPFPSGLGVESAVISAADSQGARDGASHAKSFLGGALGQLREPSKGSTALTVM